MSVLFVSNNYDKLILKKVIKYLNLKIKVIQTNKNEISCKSIILSLIENIDENVKKYIDYCFDIFIPAVQQLEDKNKSMPIIMKFNKDLDFIVYLCKNKLSIADIIMYPCIYKLLKQLDLNNLMILKKYSNIIRYFDNLQCNIFIEKLIEIPIYDI